jgi:hypothetical protein
MRILLLLVIVFVGSGPPRLAAAGAWLQPRGGSYLKASGLYSATEERIDCRGEVEPAEPFGGTYSERKIFLYGEFGLFDRMTLVGSFGFGEQKIVDASVPDYGTRSSGDLKIGTRWGLLRSPATPVSVETVLSVPTYPTTDVTLPVGQREQFLPAGTGEFEFEVRLQAGASFYPGPGWPVRQPVAVGRRSRGRSGPVLHEGRSSGNLADWRHLFHRRGRGGLDQRAKPENRAGGGVPRGR